MGQIKNEFSPWACTEWPLQDECERFCFAWQFPENGANAPKTSDFRSPPKADRARGLAPLCRYGRPPVNPLANKLKISLSAA
jgi:hypothetical protein